MMNRKRVMALVLCLGVAFVLAASSFFILHEADHDCVGEGCEICANIAATVRLLRGFALMGAIMLSLFAALLAVRKCRRAAARHACPTLTPVGWKVRLNN